MNARVMASTNVAPSDLNHIVILEMRLARRLPISVNPSQKPMALTINKATEDPETEPSASIPTTIATRTIPRTSSTTAAANMMTPSIESSRLMSPSTRAVIPTEVAVRIAPTNNAGIASSIESKLAYPNHNVTIAPSANGNITPPRATTVAGRMNFRNCLRSVSSPASNSSNTAPSCPTKYRVKGIAGSTTSLA